MSDDVPEQILIHVKEFPFYSIQSDQCTDITGLHQLSVFYSLHEQQCYIRRFVILQSIKIGQKE